MRRGEHHHHHWDIIGHEVMMMGRVTYHELVHHVGLSLTTNTINISTTPLLRTLTPVITGTVEKVQHHHHHHYHDDETWQGKSGDSSSSKNKNKNMTLLLLLLYTIETWLDAGHRCCYRRVDVDDVVHKQQHHHHHHHNHCCYQHHRRHYQQHYYSNNYWRPNTQSAQLGEWINNTLTWYHHNNENENENDEDGEDDNTRIE